MSEIQRGLRLRRIVTTAAIILVGLALFFGGTVGRSGAKFVQKSANTGNLFSAGSITLTSTKSGAAVLSAVGLVPGGSANGTLTIGTTGNYTAAVTLTGKTDNSALAQALTLKIEDVTGTATTLWTGTMSSFSTLSLGNLATGASKSYRFTVTLPTTAPSALSAKLT
jgi:hypothetical protein